MIVVKKLVDFFNLRDGLLDRGFPRAGEAAAVRCVVRAAAIAVSCLVLVAPFRAEARRTPPGGHFVVGGIGGIVRANYGTTATGSVNGIGTIALPRPNTVYMLPLTVTNFAESSDFTLLAGGTVLINTTGLYHLALSVDWPGQSGVDVDLRYYGIGRVRQGQTLSGKQVGTLFDINNASYDNLGVIDIPGSDSPTYARAQVTWSPGTLQPGGFATVDVTLSQTGIVQEGDFVQVSDTALTDDTLGIAKNNAISLTGRVIAPNVVRVFFDNLRSASPVTVPSGTINIIAGSSINSRGQSADAWDVIQSPDVMLYAGEQIFGVWKSKTPGDFLQVSNQTYLQVTLQARLH